MSSPSPQDSSSGGYGVRFGNVPITSGIFIVVVVLSTICLCVRRRRLLRSIPDISGARELVSREAGKGTPPEVISSLTVLRFPWPGVDHNDTCAICFQEYQPGELIHKLPCDHYYHMACIDQWLSRDTTCPLCKASVTPLANEEARPSRQSAEPSSVTVTIPQSSIPQSPPGQEHSTYPHTNNGLAILSLQPCRHYGHDGAGDTTPSR